MIAGTNKYYWPGLRGDTGLVNIWYYNKTLFWDDRKVYPKSNAPRSWVFVWKNIEL